MATVFVVDLIVVVVVGVNVGVNVSVLVVCLANVDDIPRDDVVVDKFKERRSWRRQPTKRTNKQAARQPTRRRHTCAYISKVFGADFEKYLSLKKCLRVGMPKSSCPGDPIIL